MLIKPSIFDIVAKMKKEDNVVNKLGPTVCKPFDTIKNILEHGYLKKFTLGFPDIWIIYNHLK